MRTVMSRMNILSVVTIFMVLISFVGIGVCAKYPAKPINYVVCYPPGGDSDLISRIWADFAEKELGVPVIVVNKAGGGGIVGTTYASHAKADGYTLFSAQAGQNLVAPMINKTAYNFDSFTYIAQQSIGAFGFVVSDDAPWNSLEEFIADAKKRPNEITFATIGTTTYAALIASYWEEQAGIKLKHVVHQGAAPAMSSVLGKHVDCTIQFPQVYTSHVKAGKVRLLALGEKSEKFSGVPSFNDLGFKGSFYGWTGLAAPAGTPDAIIQKLETLTREKIITNPDYQKAMKNINASISFVGTEEWTKTLDTQGEEIGKVVDKLGVRVQ